MIDPTPKHRSKSGNTVENTLILAPPTYLVTHHCPAETYIWTQYMHNYADGEIYITCTG